MKASKGLVIATFCLVFFILLNTILGSFKKELFSNDNLELRNEASNYLAKSFINYASGNKAGLYKTCNADVFPSFSIRGSPTEDWKTNIANSINTKSYELIKDLILENNCIIISTGPSLSGSTAYIIPIPKHNESSISNTVNLYDSELLNNFFKQNGTFSAIVPPKYQVVFVFDNNERINVSPVVNNTLTPKNTAKVCLNIEVFYENITTPVLKVHPGISVTPVIDQLVRNDREVLMSNYIPTGIDINSSVVRYTISVWIKQTNVQGNWRNVFQFGAHGAWPNSDRTPGLWIYPNKRSLHFRVRTQNNFNDGYDIDESQIPALNTWYHVLFIVNGRQLQGYLNGKRIYSVTLGGGEAIWGPRKDKHFKAFSEGATGGIEIQKLYMLPYVTPETGTSPGNLSIATLYSGEAALPANRRV